MNILTPRQYGFRAQHSASMALIDIYDKISDAIEKKKDIMGLFIDLQKAFDTIDHNILIKKLYHYGIRGVPLKWFESYLTNRQQFVVLNDITSEYKSITCGVPQRSVLGPLLFLLYINNIVNSSELFYFILFADDTNMLYSDENVDSLISVVNLELIKLSCWFKANKMSLNLKKTNFVMFSSKSVDISKISRIGIMIDNYIIEQVSSVKFLGIHIDEKLNWKSHIAVVVTSISKIIGILGRVRYKLPQEALITLYNAMILPHLNYCCIVGATLTNPILIA